MITLFVKFQGCDWLKVVESDDYQDYFATNVLVDGCSDPSVKGMNTWWATGAPYQFSSSRSWGARSWWTGSRSRILESTGRSEE